MTDLGDPPAFAATCAGIDNLDAEVDHEIDIAALESMPRLERVAEVRERRAKFGAAHGVTKIDGRTLRGKR